MQPTVQLKFQEVMDAFRSLENIYPGVLPLTMWRAWEVAAYRRFKLAEPVLDLACGDGSFFRLTWPEIRDVVGIDLDKGAAERAQSSGVYRTVENVSASELPFENNSFESVFSNCALEHMDDIEGVLREANRVLRQKGQFLLSVVTDHFLDWTPLPFLTGVLGFPERWAALQEDYLSYHHLRNPFPVEEWIRLFEVAGFVVEEHIPILPDTFAHFFLFLDQLWHIPYEQTEASTALHPVLLKLPNYSEGMQDVLSGLYKLSTDHRQGAGAVFALRKS